MKIRHHFFHLLLLLLSSPLLFAQSLCIAPVPSSGTVISQGSDFAIVHWDNVPGAASYQIRTFEATTGNLINQTITTTNNYDQQGLFPGVDYTIEIRASYCPDGPYGGPLSLSVKTDIVIVDIILQMECSNEGNTSSYPVLAGDVLELDFDQFTIGCYAVNIETIIGEEIVNIDLALKQLPGGQLTLGNPSYNPLGFQLNGLGPVIGSFYGTEQNGRTPLFLLTLVKNSQQNLKVEFEWLLDATITVTACNGCEFIYDGHDEIRVLTEQVSATDLKISPNPVNSLLLLQRPQEGLLQIWDISGRNWLNLAPNGDQHQLEIDVSHWPAGIYIMQWHQPDLPPYFKYFLKL
ncbi:hypothetical protein [Lewinella sp. LCG006]|uniref:hypothetical protein n=1 Tax=Lewinella sp. LCG006 TaxID=3231911 RepID=UPI0034601A3C